MPDLSDADALSVALAHLKASLRVLDEFGDAAHVSGIVEAPWPHLVVEGGPGGSLGDLVSPRTTEEVVLSVYGDPRGTQGPAECKRLAKVALVELAGLPNATVTIYDPVVSDVRPSGTAARLPLLNGQYGYTVGALVTIRPPQAATP
jgi:hypothetical protein